MEFAASITDRKSPVDRLPLGIALGNIGIDASSQGGVIANAASKAGARQDGEFHFGHIEPATVFGGVVEFQLSGDGSSPIRGRRVRHQNQRGGHCHRPF